MNYLIVSDIHGCLPRLEQTMEHFERLRLDMLLVLGDILNYGPRNGLPEGLSAPGVTNLLNQYADRIIAIRGNCDAEVDQKLLHFPMMSDYAMVADNGCRLFLTHGHRYNADHLPPTAFEVFLHGHTHLWTLTRTDGPIICNTGSITFPKNGNPPTFATLIDRQLTVRTLDGKPLASLPVTRSVQSDL